MSTREQQPPKSPVDRLVEAGLAAYGRGELDDALVAWEQALALDPSDTRALGYVDYVRQHYELVTGAAAPAGDEDLGVPFGLGAEDGDYEIEVTVPRAAVGRAPSPRLAEATDEGWTLDDDPRSRAPTVEAPGPTLELEAEEPPADFEQARTAEYKQPAHEEGGRRRQPSASSPGFLPTEHKTDPGDEEFKTLEATTGLGQRALGFVQPNTTRRRPSRPALKVTIRTPDDDLEPVDAPGGAASTPGSIPAAAAAAAAAAEPDVEPEPLAAPPPPPRRSVPTAPGVTLGADDDELGPALGEDVSSAKPTLEFASASEGPTRDLGIRPGGDRAAHRADTVQDDAATARTRTQEARLRILAEVDRDAPAGETPDQRTKRRIAALIAYGQGAARQQELERAILAIDAAFAEDPDSAAAHKLIQQNRDAIFSVFHDYLGDLDRRPQLGKPLHDVLDEPLDPRAAFLLSRVDGALTFEELLDVSGMPRLEAGRYVCQLVLRGLLAAE